GETTANAREDTLSYFAKCLADNGRKLSSDMISLHINCYVADSKEKALEEAGPYLRYLFSYLYQYDQGPLSSMGASGYNSPDARAHFRKQAAPLPTFRGVDPDQLLARITQGMPIGSPDEVVDGILREVETSGAGNVLLMCNGGAMPQEM